MKIVPPSHIVLGGGGMKCLAYIGAFEMLEKENLLKHIKYFHGVSAGALMSFAYIIGYTVHEMKEVITSMDFHLLQNIDEHFALELFESFGLDNGYKLEKFIESLLKHKGLNREITFQQLFDLKKKTFLCYAVDLNEGSYKTFSVKTTPNYSVLTALRASMSLPGYFCPVTDPVTKHLLVDGALLNNYPIELIEDSSVLGLDFMSVSIYNESIDSIQSYFYQLFSCLYNKFQEIPETNKDKTIYINCKTHILDFFATQEERLELIQCGADAVKHYLQNQKVLIERRNSI